MKFCWKCEQDKPEYDFPCLLKGDWVGPRMTYCRSCCSNAAKKWNINNKEWIANYNKKYRKQRNAIYKAKKSLIVNSIKNNPCLDCGNSYDPICMDFDHIKEIKIANISKMVDSNNYSYFELENEIKKCELVCSNCHRLRTHKRRINNMNLNKETQSFRIIGA